MRNLPAGRGAWGGAGGAATGAAAVVGAGGMARVFVTAAEKGALGAGAAGYGLFFGLLEAGMIVGSLGMAWLNDRVAVRQGSVYGLCGMGLCILALASTQTTTPMYALAVVLGFFGAVGNISVMGIFQGRVAPEYYGRVGSLLNMVGTAGQPLTLLALAPVADHVSVALIFAVAGGVTLLGAAGWSVLLRAERASVPPVLPA